MKEKGGLSYNEYTNIHKWLSRNFGKAECCESDQCDGECKKYQYALIKGKRYDKNRENFIKLCISCHLKYDWDESKRKSMRIMTKERREKIGAANKGKKRTAEQRIAMSERNKGEKNPFYGKGRKGELNPMWGKQLAPETRKKIFEKNRKLSDEQVLEIRKLISTKIEQKEIAKRFNVARSTICRIVNHKRYNHGLHV